MATANKSIRGETSTKSQYAQALTLFLVLLLISPLFAHPAYFSSSYSQLFSSSSPSSAQQSVTSSTPATTFTSTSSSSATATTRDREFWTAAHAVPSGPNPESNKNFGEGFTPM